ncbi:MAG TPA: biotin/lipoyl-containing protein [Armatimonadota bacterium]|nr:biotin/lipoyl-containing protein [Armatimonadota bacterium]
MSALANDDIQWVIALAEREDLVELEVNVGDAGVLVRRGGPVGVQATAMVTTAPIEVADPCADGDLVPVVAPMAGAFYRSSAPDVPFFAEEGADVQEGETVALIEAMKLYNDVEAPCTGRVEKILVEDASRVAADQHLMLIRPLG